jgi:hypothetical protein
VSNPKGSYFEDIDAAVCTPHGPHPLADPGSNAPATPAPIPADQPLSSPLRPSEAPDAPLPRTTTRPASPPPASPPPAKPAAQAVARSGGQAQIIAAPSEAKAKEALSALRAAEPSLMRGLSSHVERIDRDGVAYYRALVSGFTPPMDAAGFCRRLSASGRACIVR